MKKAYLATVKNSTENASVLYALFKRAILPAFLVNHRSFCNKTTVKNKPKLMLTKKMTFLQVILVVHSSAFPNEANLATKRTREGVTIS
jgi:hypothetical protein